uniref:Primase subunit of helicase-primase complex n=1 Tax=Otarine gammaherpesvirus 4 TaxID=2801541 RepID=A0A889IW92_9GAMA|nr:Primase subunit of helicase-primase complex [Otarine gammaherpesvirus 4]
MSAVQSDWCGGDVCVVFATDVDCAETIADILCGEPNSALFYSVVHNCYFSSDEMPPIVAIDLRLPARRPGCGERSLRALRTCVSSQDAKEFLVHGKPLTAYTIWEGLDRRAAKETFHPVLEVLACGSGNVTGTTLRSQIHWQRSKFVAAIRRLFRICASPHWMLTTFGAHESHFVLVAGHYFFSTCVCTVDTLMHIARLFDQRRGRSLATITTLAELGVVYSTSVWISSIPAFVQYAQQKMNRDDEEMICVDDAVNAFRGKLTLSSCDLVQYIYLAFFQCMNKQTFLEYSLLTRPEKLHMVKIEPVLARAIDESFRSRMATYYNRDTYIGTHVHASSLPITITGGYDPRAVGDTDHVYEPGCLVSMCSFWVGQATDVATMLTRVAREFPDAGITPDLRGLLCAGATFARNTTGLCSSVFMQDDGSGASGSLPVFRCEFLNKNYFALMRLDNIGTFWKSTISLPSHWNTDADIVRGITYDERCFSARSLVEQMCLSRHEYFNPALPVYNLVLDFDLKMYGRALTLLEIIRLATLLRFDVLGVLRTLGHVDNNHPVYFFKSACLPRDEFIYYDNGCEPPFCTCTEKLGMRLVSPLPRGVALVGTAAIVALVNVLNRVVRMNAEIATICSPDTTFADSSGPFDVGIYHRGRCVRLPHTYKVESCGRLVRLLKLFPCHPQDANRSEYLVAALRPWNLMHHSHPDGWLPPSRVFYEVVDTDENFLRCKTLEQLPRAPADVVCRIESTCGGSALQWVTLMAWPRLYNTITSYLPDDVVHQFQSVAFDVVSQSLVKVRPQRGGNFRCLKFKHRGGSQTVRVFLLLHAAKSGNINVTFMTQCFADKCHNNRPMAHFTVSVPLSTTS